MTGRATKFSAFKASGPHNKFSLKGTSNKRSYSKSRIFKFSRLGIVERSLSSSIRSKFDDFTLMKKNIDSLNPLQVSRTRVFNVSPADNNGHGVVSLTADAMESCPTPELIPISPPSNDLGQELLLTIQARPLVDLSTVFDDEYGYSLDSEKHLFS